MHVTEQKKILNRIVIDTRFSIDQTQNSRAARALQCHSKLKTERKDIPV